MVYPARRHAVKTLEKLAALLPVEDRIKPQILLLAGEVTPYRNDTDRELPFRQESNFHYLSGCSVPYSLLIIAATSASVSEPSMHTVFIPPIEPADLMWSVPPPTLEAARQMHDIDVAQTADLPKFLADALAIAPDALIHVLPTQSGKFPDLSNELITLAKAGPGAHVTDAYALEALGRARLTKDPEEIDRIRKANSISSRAHETVMRVLGQGVRGLIQQSQGAGVDRPLLPGEWLIEKEAEAEAIFVASCRREGAVHQAYLPIVAASTRAATLHYCCNDRELAWGPTKPDDHQNRATFVHGHSRGELLPQVLLIDAGCEWECYAADITRTMPVGNGGKFTPEARAIYELVHEMQRVAFESLKPDLHWDTVQLLCHRTLVRGFQKLGLFKTPESPGSGSWNSEEAILASGVSAAFFPHGLGHSLGMDVHDVPLVSKPAVNGTIPGLPLGHESFYTYLRLRLPLEENMVVTVEPGIYFHQHLLEPVRDSKHIDHEVLKRYESVGGVRIEDVVRITADSYENFTTIRSDVEWVEGVCSGAL
ncbi:Creatinase/aminopeptidase [Vararia minispora EC-137]|uniref:Creatinase/aminopeptidase n=1 Tax=Vararia minispora EC-137 TaxID=1314806 RepID=A0ACB8QHC7_9AGAM|nr:Creatinase/aminopeptidase [Vararia minispora EC-137]